MIQSIECCPKAESTYLYGETKDEIKVLTAVTKHECILKVSRKKVMESSHHLESILQRILFE